MEAKQRPGRNCASRGINYIKSWEKSRNLSFLSQLVQKLQLFEKMVGHIDPPPREIGLSWLDLGGKNVRKIDPVLLY